MVKRISFGILTWLAWILFAFFYIVYPVYYTVAKCMMRAPTTAAKVAGTGLVVIFIGFIVFYKNLKKFLHNLPENAIKHFILSVWKILPILIISIILKLLSNSQTRIDTAVKLMRTIFTSCCLGIFCHLMYLRFNEYCKMLRRTNETEKTLNKANARLLEQIQNIIKP